MVRSAEGGSETSMPIGSHDEFLELCALAASGELTRSEHKKLSSHLAICSSCREAKKQFASLVGEAVPSLAAEEHAATDLGQDSNWSVDVAEAALFERLAKQQSEERDQVQPGREVCDAKPRQSVGSAIDAVWRQVWMSYAAGILLIISLAIAAYMGGRHSAPSHKPSVAALVEPTGNNKLEEQISDLAHGRELQRAEIARRDRVIAELKHELQQQSTALARLKVTQTQLEQAASVRKSGQDFSEPQAALQQKLQQAESNTQSLQAKLEAMQNESSQERGKMVALNAKVEDLTRALQEKEGEIEEQQQLLAHDRDIRELMGARDLYISEVYDVAGTGETKKPFGRVFYTREKSLVFYAYDLNQVVGARNASTFQAWGRRGPDRSQALNLGIFYQDNATKKRWVLKFNDPKTLAQIDAVFVTVEPGSGSRKPSGKPLLFAYLKMDANHP